METPLVTTYEEACQVTGTDPNALPDVTMLPEEDQKSVIAYCKLIVLAKALNDGWVPAFTDGNQPKYWPWFWVERDSYGASAGLSCTYTNYAASHAYANIGSRLCFKTRELARYAGETFTSLYRDYLLK